MAKDVIPVEGEDRVVREDTARAYRGVYWALASIAVFIIIMVLLFAMFFMRSGANSPGDPPTRSTEP
jgi:hypothetical protein